MKRIAFDGKDFTLDAELLADSFDTTPGAVLAGLRDGRITSICETGVEQDAGRYRLTFFHESRRLRLVVDAGCNILRQSVVNFGQAGIPPAARRRGG